MPLPAFVAAAIAVRMCGPIATDDAPFLVDGAFALIVAITMTLPFLDYAAPTIQPRAAILRGLLWGTIAGLGALSKVTFGLFGAVVTPLLLLASVGRSGVRATLYKSAAASLMCAIPGLMFVRYGSMYLANGWRSAYGDLAQYYTNGQSTWASIQGSAAAAGYPFWIICAALLLAGFVRGRRDVPRLVLSLTIVTLTILYLVLAASSLNRQPRFLWPVWLVLPFAAAGAIAPSREPPTPSGMRSGALVWAVAVVWSLPMVSRFDFQPVREADTLLRFLKTDHAIRVEVASDPPFFNINTLLLAQQVDWKNLWIVDVREVVYDATRGPHPAGFGEATA